jgi:hypothetical protein
MKHLLNKNTGENNALDGQTCYRSHSRCTNRQTV